MQIGEAIGLATRVHAKIATPHHLRFCVFVWFLSVCHPLMSLLNVFFAENIT